MCEKSNARRKSRHPRLEEMSGMPRQPVPPATLPLRAYLGQPMQAATAALYKKAARVRRSLHHHRMPLRERKR